METQDDKTQLVHTDIIEAIRKEVQRRGLSDVETEFSSGSQKGDNYLGVIAKVKITGKNGEGKVVRWNWIAKIAPSTEMFRKIIKIDVVYDREIYMYRLLERFDHFQEEKGVYDKFDNYPKFIMSYMEPLRESFVMEDMKSIGYVMRNRKRPLDLNHVKLVMKAYGKLHAISFALRDQKPEEFVKISQETAERFFSEHDDKMDEMIKYQDNFTVKLREMITVEDPFYESFNLYLKEPITIIMNRMKNPSRYSVIGHGDSWINNMLWKYGDAKHPNVPTHLCILDWQLARYGSPAFDLSYFIYACTDKEFRDKYYDDMIRLYYHTLCAHLTELGSNPEEMFPMVALEEELHEYSILGIHMSVMVLQLILSEADEVPDWGNSENIEEMMNMMGFKSVNQDYIRERIRGVVENADEKKYFDYLRKN